MKPIARKAGRKRAFTIIELLTVMSIIVILIGLIVPSLNMVRRYAKRVKQKAQFHTIDVSIELFYNEWDGYPPSSQLDQANLPYCGAMKLAEAMLGQDLQGFDPDSSFRRDGRTADNGPRIYEPFDPPGDLSLRDLSDRRKYLPVANTNFYRLNQIYNQPRYQSQFGGANQLESDKIVLYDEYSRGGTIEGKRVGMPVLYYRANHSLGGHYVDNANNPQNIYNYKDNDQLVCLGLPWDMAAHSHPMASDGGPTLRMDASGNPIPARPEIFYEKTWNRNISIPTPYRSDSYILLSAGFDGEYGTKDDVFNFGM